MDGIATALLGFCPLLLWENRNRLIIVIINFVGNNQYKSA